MKIPPGLCAPISAVCSHGWHSEPHLCPACRERRNLIRVLLATQRLMACRGPGVKLERAQGELMAAMEPFYVVPKRKKVTR